MRVNFVLTEMLTGLRRNLTMTLAMVLTTAVSLALLGAGGLLVNQVSKMKDYFYYQVELTVFLKGDASSSQRDAIRQQLNKDPQVASSTFENRNEAYTRFREQFKSSPELVKATKPSDLPESFRVKLKNPSSYNEVALKYRVDDGVDTVINQQQLYGKLFHILDLIRNVALVIALIVGIAALLLIGNTIQVAAFSRRREVGIMKLVGASNWYIQLPFVLEAAFAGLVGAVLGWGVLVAAKYLVMDNFLKGAFAGVIPTWSWPNLLVALPSLAVAAAVISAIVGWITLRFQIKI